MKSESTRFAVLAVAAVPLAVVSAHASAAIDVNLDLRVGAIIFSPTDIPYVLFPGLSASGFTDPEHPDNEVRVASNNGVSPSFHGYTLPGQGTGGSGSSGFSNASTLSAGITNESVWRMTIIDGATAETAIYTFELTTIGLPADLIRLPALNVVPGDVLPASLTALYPAPTDPDNAYTSNYLALSDLAGFYTDVHGGPLPDPLATSLTPPALLPVGPSYVFYGTAYLDITGRGFLSVSSPSLEEGPDLLGELSASATIESTFAIYNLRAVPEPTTAAVVAPAALLLARRRR